MLNLMDTLWFEGGNIFLEIVLTFNCREQHSDF